MSEPVQLTAKRWMSSDPTGEWAIYAQKREIGQVRLLPDYTTIDTDQMRVGLFAFWRSNDEAFGERGTDSTLQAAAVALARACGIDNPLPPETWP